MKAFALPTLLTLLFVTSVIIQGIHSSSMTTPTTNTTTPIVPNSMADPPANTTTPIAPNSTADPPANTTTPIASNSTAAPTANTTTPIASNSTTAPTTTAKGLCQKDSCHDGSSCVSLNNSHFCLCVDGYYYQSFTCNKGKVFPGTIKVNISETSGLENKKSPAYEKLYMEVTKFFEDALKNYDFRQTVIYEVRVSAPARAEVRAGDKLVDVVVVNLLPETTKQNETTISNAINEAISNNPNGFISYARQDRCEFYGCEKTNEQDDCSDGLQCKCKEGLERPNPQTALCLVPKCVDTCNAKHNMQCLVKDSGVPECVCLPGYQKDDRGNCQQCAFGYSGVNCEDQFQLILTIVGTIAGILILGMVIALIFIRSKKNKNLEEQNLIENDFQDLRLQHTTGFSNLGGEGSIFPKVRATAPKDSQMQNPYVQRSMPRPDY